MMVIYSVTITVKIEIEKEWFDWMKNIHAPKVVKTGCFSAFKMYKVLIPSNEPGEVSYKVDYFCESYEQYKTYSETEATKLQREHAEKFHGKITTARAVFEEI